MDLHSGSPGHPWIWESLTSDVSVAIHRALSSASDPEVVAPFWIFPAIMAQTLHPDIADEQMVNPWINHHHHHREPPKPASFRSSSSKHRAGPDKQPAPARTSAKAERRMAPVSSMSVLPVSLQTSVEDQIISVQSNHIKP